MKKSILFVIALFPLLASCNNNSRGFINPFPDDTYNPTGLNFKSEERIVRTLTSTEQTLVNDSYGDCPGNDEYIRQHDVVIETRDYTRAFAGVFGQGYSISNIKETEIRHVTRQNYSENPAHKQRTIIDSNLDAIYDYAYGRNTSNIDTDEWHYYAKNSESNNPVTVVEADKEDGAIYIVSQTQTEGVSPVGALLAKKTDTDWDTQFSIGLEQSNFFTQLSECSSTPGADSNNNIILVKSEQNKYHDPDPEHEVEDGIYQLPDGRMYQAMQNSLTVSKLELKKNIDGKDRYLVSYARRYTETTITSDVIQPNIPITVLANPIVIHYSEETHIFKTEEGTPYDGDIDPISIDIEEANK